jgi:hypothetical protein
MNTEKLLRVMTDTETNKVKVLNYSLWTWPLAARLLLVPRVER